MRTESGHKHENLPYLECGDKAVISPVHPVVTVKKNHYANKKLRLESISLVQDPVPTWSKILPRTSLADRIIHFGNMSWVFPNPYVQILRNTEGHKD